MSDAGRSFILKSINAHKASMSCEPLNAAVSDEAFNVDRNMNDMLLIYEEFQNKYLGGGDKNSNDEGVRAHSEKDTTNFFKSRLTSGSCTTLPWFMDNDDQTSQ